ncbi:MAG: sortase [Nitriliruptoraceae bacterium]
MSRTLTRALLAIGTLLLVGTPLAWYGSQPAPVVGDLPDSYTASDQTPSSPPPAEQPAESPAEAVADGGVAPPVPPTVSAGLRGPLDGGEDRISPPVRVSLPGIGVQDASVADVGLDATGAVEIPDDVQEVGWYRRSPRPGEPGNAFMTSHVDSRTQGRGVLFDLRRSEPGQTILIDHEDGSQSVWEIVRRERITKGAYPLDQVFRFDGEPGLVIDTCGGAFDPSTGSYESIDIVYAVPLDA